MCRSLILSGPTCNCLQLLRPPPTSMMCPQPQAHTTPQRKEGKKMLKEEQNGDRINTWGRICKACRSAPCTVYCRDDSAYPCTGCDPRIHAATGLASRHERMWICEPCECAPASFICKADAASLCTTCDADIHSADPLAQRHHRVPVLPIPGCHYDSQAADPGGPILGIRDEADDGFLDQETDEAVDEDEVASRLLINPFKNNHNQISTNGLLFGGEAVDEHLDFVEYNLCQDNQQQYGVPQKSYGGDSVVPVQCGEANKIHQFQQQQKFQLDYETSNTGYGYPASRSHSVSVSSADVGVVPQSTVGGVSISHPRPSKGPPIQMPAQLTPMEREARVLRYREKKKTRKFEKKIRYASRKAYAESRPRIKGRFTKRTDVDAEVDQMFSSNLMAENGYGIVPSF